MDDWTAPHVLEMLDREIKALKELILSEVRRLDEEGDSLSEQLDRRVRTLHEQRAAGRVEYDGRIENLRTLIETLSSERQRATEKFEETVSARFVQINEFRGSLDDLGKTMATRRELEAAVASIKTETTTALAAANAKGDEQGRQLSDLRSRIDTGAPAGQTLGFQQRSQQVGAAMIGWVTVGVLVLSVLAAIIVRLA